MKKITRIICLVLVVAMATLACVSCGMSAEERVAVAIAKMSEAKKTDISGTMNIKMNMGGITMEMPVSLKVKTDMSDEANPAEYTFMAITMSMFGETMEIETEITYKDGWMYIVEEDEKGKCEVSYDELLESEISTSTVDFTDLLAEKKDDLAEGVEITENEDGTLSVKITFAEEEFGEELSEAIADFTSAMIDEGDISVGDTVFELTIDKDNNITDIKTTIALSLKIEGETVNVEYDINFKYNVIGEDFAINAPADADEYEEFDFEF